MIIPLINILINTILISKFSHNTTPYAIKPLINSCIILIIWSFADLITYIIGDQLFVLDVNHAKFWFHLIMMPSIYIVLFELYNRKKISKNFIKLSIVISTIGLILSTLPNFNSYVYNGKKINISNNIFLESELSILNYITIIYISIFVIVSVRLIFLINRKMNKVNVTKTLVFVCFLIIIYFIDKTMMYIFKERIFNIVPLIFSAFYISMYSTLEAATHNRSTLNIIEIISNSVDSLSLGYSRSGNIVYANAQAIEAFDYPKNYINGVNVYDNKNIKEKLDKEILQLRDKFYKKYLYNVFYNGKFMATGINYVNITKETLLNEKLKLTSKTDWLIGTKNRNAFLDTMESTNLEDYEDLAFIVMDLDNLKITNDLFGHEAGNEILKKVPILVEKTFKDINFDLFRVGGDEFIIICKNVCEEKIKSKIDSLYIETSSYNKNNRLQLLFSIGCAMKNNLATSIKDLYIYADVAMYNSKNSGKNRLTFFTEDLYKRFIRNNKIKDNFDKALKEGKIKPRFQPVYNCNKDLLEYVEVYHSWDSEEFSQVSHDEFIDVAKNLGLIIDLDLHILEETCSFFHKIDKEVAFCVNFSIDSFLSNTIFYDIKNILKSNLMMPQNLIIQVNDSPLTSKVNTATENLLKLKDYGVKISLRNFGKGFSNIDSINRLGNELITIHPSLMDSKSLLVVCKLLKNQGCKIIAIDIDNKDKYDLALENLFDYMIGDYLAPCVDLETFEKRGIYELN